MLALFLFLVSCVRAVDREVDKCLLSISVFQSPF